MTQNKKFGFLSHLDLNLYLFRSPIMKVLLSQGHTVYAICPKGDKNRALEELGCKVINYEITREGLNPLKEKMAVENIYNAIKGLHLDLLHTFTAKPNIYGTFAAKKANIPLIVNLVEGLGSFYLRNNFKSRLVRTIMEKLYKRAFKISDACVFVNSDDPKYMLNKKIIDKKKVKIIKSVGVDKDKFSIDNFTKERLLEIKKKNNLESKTVVLMVARAIWDKGIKEYYESAKILRKKYQNVQFVLVGDTDSGNHSCANEEFLYSEDVLWLGHRDDIVELTAISDVYVLPSYREGVPATLMEAASMSKAIVTTDTVGCREVVEDSYNGFLVPVKNTIELTSKIEQLLLDPSLRETMGKNGRIKVLEEFDVDIVVKQYIDFYKEMLDE